MINTVEKKKEAEIEKYYTFLMLLRTEIRKDPNVSISRIIQKNGMPHIVFNALKSLNMISQNGIPNHEFLHGELQNSHAEKLKIETLRLKTNSLLNKVPKHLKHRNMKPITLTDELTVVSCLLKLKELAKKSDTIFYSEEITEDLKVDQCFVDVLLKHNLIETSKFVSGSYKLAEKYNPDLKLSGEVYASYMIKKQEPIKTNQIKMETDQTTNRKTETNSKYMKFFQWIADESKGEYVKISLNKNVDTFSVSKNIPYICYQTGAVTKENNLYRWNGPNPVTVDYTEELLVKFRSEMAKTCSEKSSDKLVKVQKVKAVEADTSGDKNIQKLEKERNILLYKIENIDKAIEAYKTYQKLMQNI